jgi:hypothetical protein
MGVRGTAAPSLGCLLALFALGGLATYQLVPSRVADALAANPVYREALRHPCSDLDKLTPRTTYGITKAICEMLLNDHTRKGHFDGRTARLPTVIIRPGKPNAAASSWVSGMFREPLRGEPCYLPVPGEQAHPVTGYRTVIDSLVALHEAPETALDDDRGYVLPAHTVTPDLAAAVRAIVAIGVDYAFDTTGRPDTLTATMACLGPKGVFGIVGIPPAGTPMPGDLGTVLTFGQTVRGIIEGDSDPDVFLPELMTHWREGRLPLERLIKTFPLAQINEAVVAQHHGDCVKVVLLT